MERCVTNESYERLTNQYPQYEQNRQRIEQEIQQIIANREVVAGITTIPVVYHVIHDGDAIGSNENLTEALLQAQLNQMNDDFRRTNSDADNTWAQAADSEIEFCLAQIDPNGNATTGINRIHVNTLTGVNTADCWDDDYIDANIKPPTIWNRDNYLNIWTVFKLQRSSDCANTLLGYAQFPGGPANSDGLVLKSTTVGSIANPNPAGGAFALGRTGTHEVGHWLNLIHIWGDGNCSFDDGVADTPSSDAPNYGCPTTHVSCSSTDMVQNYMDYSDDSCMNLFTQGQADRMNAAIAASRPGLLTSQCGPSCEVDLVLSGTLTEPTYEASNSITTSGTTNVPSTNDVNLRAPDYVRLNAGFSTTGAAGLDIRYGGCNLRIMPDTGEPSVESFRTEQPQPTSQRPSRPTAEELERFRNPNHNPTQNHDHLDDYSPEERARLIARDRGGE
jgi:hypothetical protein